MVHVGIWNVISIGTSYIDLKTNLNTNHIILFFFPISNFNIMLHGHYMWDKVKNNYLESLYFGYCSYNKEILNFVYLFNIF